MVSKWFWKICSWSVRSINNLKRNGQKQFKKKLRTNFFFSTEERQLKERTFIGESAAFKLLVVLSIAKLYTHDIIFRCLELSRYRNSNLYILFFVKWKTHRIVFYLPCQTITVYLRIFFSVKQSGRLRNKS